MALVFETEAGGKDDTARALHTLSYPTGVVDGDIVFNAVCVTESNGGVNLSWSADGFVKIGEVDFDDSFDLGTGGVAYVRADGTEGDDFTVGSSELVRIAHRTWRISGQHTTTNPEAVFLSGTDQDDSPDPPQITPSWGAELSGFIALCGYIGSSSETVDTAPSSYGDLNQDGAASSGANKPVLGSSRRIANVSPENPGVYTLSATRRYFTITAAIRPAAAGGVDIAVPLKAFTLSAQIPIVGSGVNVPVPLQTLTLNNLVPIVGSGANVDVPVKVLSLNNLIPIIGSGVGILVPLKALTLANLIPSITTGGAVEVAVPLKAFTLNNQVPIIGISTIILVPLKAFTLSNLIPIIVTGVGIIVPLKAFTLTNLVPDVTTAGEVIIQVPLKTFFLQPQVPDIPPSAELIIAVPLKTFTLTKFKPIVTAFGDPFTIIDLNLTPPFEEHGELKYLVENFSLIKDILEGGDSASFTTSDGKTVVVRNGIVVDVIL